jgi:hypothetical protein
MSLFEQPIANGVRTDHPIPGLPFVDDSHIPVDDPEAIEQVGRHSGTDTWGRFDIDHSGEWMAFTTDPKNHAFGWAVRYHPEHGRSVVLYRDDDAASVHADWFGERPLLQRLGGYWWDGDTWYRPRQVLSFATESYMRRKVEHPTTITANDLLDSSCKPVLGNLHKIMQLDLTAATVLGVPDTQWRHDLALWAARRRVRDDALPLDRCVVTLNAPELTANALLGVEEFAQEAGIAASTLRAYLARNEADLPVPQVTDDGRKRWAHPVVRDWVERRQRDTSNVVSVLSGDAEDQLAPGLRSLWARLTKSMFSYLWDRPEARRQWSRPHRTEQVVRSVAEHTAWIAALTLDSEVPWGAIVGAIEDSVLAQMSRYHEFAETGTIGLDRRTGQLLGWLIRHQPDRTPALFGSITREAERTLDITPRVTTKTLTNALQMDGGFTDRTHLKKFFAVALPPEQ